MELLNGKFDVTITNNNASLIDGWKGCTQAKVFRVKSLETKKHCYVKVYGAMNANITEEHALYYLLDDACTYKQAEEYKGIEDYLVNDLCYNEYIENEYGCLKKNPELLKVKKGLCEQYNKIVNMGLENKLYDLLDEFRNKYDY